jgi:hypothetical protein
MRVLVFHCPLSLSIHPNLIFARALAGRSSAESHRPSATAREYEGGSCGMVLAGTESFIFLSCQQKRCGLSCTKMNDDIKRMSTQVSVEALFHMTSTVSAVVVRTAYALRPTSKYLVESWNGVGSKDVKDLLVEPAIRVLRVCGQCSLCSS